MSEVLDLRIARVIIFAKNMGVMTSFYGATLGLPRVNSPDDSAEFVSFDAGGTHVALHSIPSEYARNISIGDPPVWRESAAAKVAFVTEDVTRTRAELIQRGATMGSVQVFGELHFCDGIDPEGNIFQISNRP